MCTHTHSTCATTKIHTHTYKHKHSHAHIHQHTDWESNPFISHLEPEMHKMHGCVHARTHTHTHTHTAIHSTLTRRLSTFAQPQVDVINGNVSVDKGPSHPFKHQLHCARGTIDANLAMWPLVALVTCLKMEEKQNNAQWDLWFSFFMCRSFFSLLEGSVNKSCHSQGRLLTNTCLLEHLYN